MLLFLLGMMGAGKTTLGQQLANSLQVPFIDLDEYIVKREHKTIAQMFEQAGAVEFRKIERRALEAVVAEYPDAVIATGGGTPCFFDNMTYMLHHGTSIFLDVPSEEIFNRLRTTNLAVRPLLAGKSDEELKLFISKTLEERYGFYKQATYTLMGGHITVPDILRLVNPN